MAVFQTKAVQYLAPQPTIMGLSAKTGATILGNLPAFFEKFWGAFERELCVYNPPTSAQEAFSWAAKRADLLAEVTRLFLRYPTEAITHERLSKLLLATSSDELKNNLFADYLKMSEHIKCDTVQVYSFRPEEGPEVFEMVNEVSVFDYFLMEEANPFFQQMQLTVEQLGQLSDQDLGSLLERLEDKVIVKRGVDALDRANLVVLLSAIQLVNPQADVLGMAEGFWDNAQMVMGKKNKEIIARYTWDTVKDVIVETDSMLLFGDAQCHFTGDKRLYSPSMALEIAFEIEVAGSSREDNGADNPSFTVARAFGKSILNKHVQDSILEWVTEVEIGVTQSDYKSDFAWTLLEPLLNEYAEKMAEKSGPFNYRQKTENQVLTDIKEGRYLQLRVGLSISNTLKETFARLSVESILQARQNTSPGLDNLLKPLLADKPQDQIRHAFNALYARYKHYARSNLPSAEDQLDYFFRVYSKRFTKKPPVYLLDDAEHDKDFHARLALFNKFGLVMASQDAVLSVKASEAVRTHLLENDLNL